MAVRISGGGELDGAVLQNAATTELQEQIIRALGKNVDATNRANQRGQANSDQDRTALDEGLKKAKSVIAGSAKVAGAGLGALVGGTSNLLTGQYELSDMTKVLEDKFGNVVTGSEMVDGVFSTLTGGLHNTVGFVTDTTGAFRDLSVVGGGLEGDLIELRRTSANARLPLDQFAGIIGANSEKLISLGGTVDAGSRVLAGFSQQLFDSRAGVELLQLGIGFEETNEYLMDYLSTQRRNDVFMNMSAQEQIKQTQRYVYELDTLARLTGKNRKEIQQEARDRAREGQNQASIRLMEAKGIKGAQAEFESVSKHLSSKLSPAVADTFATMVRLDGAIDATSDAQRGLAQTMPGVTNLLSESSRAFKAGDFERSQQLREQAEAQYFKRMGSTDFLRIAELGPQAGATGQAAADLLAGSQDMLDSVNGQKKALDASGKSAATHADALRAATDRVRQGQERTGQAELMGAQVMAETLIRDTSAALYNSLDATLKPQIENLFGDLRNTLAAADVPDIQGTTDDIVGSLGGLQDKIDQLNRMEVNPDISEQDRAKFTELRKGYEEALKTLRSNAATAQQKQDARASLASIDAATRDAIEKARTTGTGTTPAPVEQDVNLFDRLQDFFMGTDGDQDARGTVKTGQIDTEIIKAGKIEGLPGRQKGSLGEAGKLFEDFGKGTPVMLHGLEAVVTPEQMKGLFKDFLSNLESVDPAGMSITNDLRDTMQRMTSQISSEMGNGAMLPNLRNEVRNFAGIAQQAAQQAQPVMQEMAQQAAPVLQDAGGEVFEMLNSKLSQLADIGSKQFRTAERQLRSTKGLSGNLLKGL